MTIDISPQTASLLREKSAREGREPSAVADSVLQAMLLADIEDYEAACAGISEGFAQSEDGESIDFGAYTRQARERRVRRRMSTDDDSK